MTEQAITTNCPVCSWPPVVAWEVLTPWFCSNPDCKCLAWDPFATLDENLMNAGPVQTSWPPAD